MEIEERLRQLGESLVVIQNQSQITTVVHLMECGLETILQVKKEKEVTEEELELLRELGKELLIYGIAEEKINKNSVQQKKLYQLTEAIKKEVEQLPKPKEKVFDNLDEWISSLNIYKYRKISIIGEVTYSDSYSLYCALRKVVLNRNTDIKTRIYTGKIVDKMDSEESRRTLSQSCKIEVVDPELFGVMRLVRNNPTLNYKMMGNSYKVQEANNTVDRLIKKNDAKMLVKRIDALKSE